MLYEIYSNRRFADASINPYTSIKKGVGFKIINLNCEYGITAYSSWSNLMNTCHYVLPLFVFKTQFLWKLIIRYSQTVNNTQTNLVNIYQYLVEPSSSDWRPLDHHHECFYSFWIVAHMFRQAVAQSCPEYWLFLANTGHSAMCVWPSRGHSNLHPGGLSWDYPPAGFLYNFGIAAKSSGKQPIDRVPDSVRERQGRTSFTQ